MKRFLVVTLSGDGKRRYAFAEAADRVQCLCALTAKGTPPVRVWTLPFSAGISGHRISMRALAILFSQLSMALQGGVSLLDALYYMEKEQDRERLGAFLGRLKQRLLSGASFSEALRKEPGVAMMLCEWVAIGEKQGRLAQVLAEIADHLDNQEKMKKQIQQQLLYPLIVLAAILMVGALLSLVVMPMLARQFIGYETKVSGVMRFFLVLHDALAAYGWVLLVGLCVLGAWGYWAGRRRHGGAFLRNAGRRFVLAVPILRRFFVLRVYVPFARFLGQMLRSGVTADEAVGALATYFQGSIFAKDVAEVAAILSEGGNLSAAIANAAFVPELARQMLMNGERYGKLSEALLNSASYYESTLFEELHLWIRFVEPLAVALLGGLVLLMALGLFLPVLESYRLLLAQ